MLILKSTHGDREVLHIEGVMNASNLGQFKEQIDRILASQATMVILDLEHLKEIDSSGIGAMVSLLKRMRTKKGDVRLLRLRGGVAKLFELLRIDRSMETYEELNEALK